LKLPSLEVARTVMLWLVGPSDSRSIEPATVTTPVDAVDRETASCVIIQGVVIVLLVASASLA